MIIKGFLHFSSVGVGRDRTRHAYLNINGSCAEIPFKAAYQQFGKSFKRKDFEQHEVKVSIR